MADKKLFIVHVGFYDKKNGDGAYEQHTNFFVIAESAADAKKQAKAKPTYAAHKMHCDSIQEINVVDGYRICPLADASLNGQTEIGCLSYEDLNPSKS